MDGSLTATLAEVGLVVASGEQRATAVPLGAADAVLLARPPGMSFLSVTRIGRSPRARRSSTWSASWTPNGSSCGPGSGRRPTPLTPGARHPDSQHHPHHPHHSAPLAPPRPPLPARPRATGTTHMNDPAPTAHWAPSTAWPWATPSACPRRSCPARPSPRASAG
ncbi:hypothetical protein NKH77_40585 [Streptomyces sp. M19]